MRQPFLPLSETNQQKAAELHSIVDAILDEILVRGFYGVGTIRFTVQDGTIQVIEKCVERKYR